MPPNFSGTEYEFVKGAAVLFEAGRTELLISPTVVTPGMQKRDPGSQKNCRTSDSDNFKNLAKV